MKNSLFPPVIALSRAFWFSNTSYFDSLSEDSLDVYKRQKYGYPHYVPIYSVDTDGIWVYEIGRAHV